MKIGARLQILEPKQQIRALENNDGVDPNVRTPSHSNYFIVKYILGCRRCLVAPDTIYYTNHDCLFELYCGNLVVLKIDCIVVY